MLLGAHVSTAGGVRNAPGRGAEIGATAIQIFTKQPNRWAEPTLDEEECRACGEGVRTHGIGFTNAHDSYLINLATADPELRARSLASFKAELRRAVSLDLDAVVTHPGNATDGNRARGLAQNAALVEEALAETPGRTLVLLETTAGAGSVLGSTFEELAEMIERISPLHRERVGICLDTCHVYSAGYDLVRDYDGVVRHLDDVVGLDRLRLFHLNDSQVPFASRRDRHAHIGEGSLGEEPFRRIMTDERFASVPRVLETPKGDDLVTADRRNLERLRALCA
ncbi:MAG TPA: deoxyribonuclease IV [Longimicrobiaceae bacterium]|nr:deoxyribonuclease IV [Longimicrobiaceae bacterium]